MTIKLNRQYRHWIPGTIVELGAGICAELIRRGVAIEVKEVAKRIIAPERNKIKRVPERAK